MGVDDDMWNTKKLLKSWCDAWDTNKSLKSMIGTICGSQKIIEIYDWNDMWHTQNH